MAKEQDELDSLIETFKLRSREETTDNKNVNNSFGENKKMDRLIIMDDVSGVADVSKKFANFLTVSRKFGYNCVYVFYVIVPASQIWQKIISQTNIFNVFPASVPHNTVARIIESNCILQSKKYFPARSLWLNRIFTDLANSHKKHCLIIDCDYINKNGLGRYRSLADNPEKQVCYFNKPNDDVFYNTFISKRIKAEKFDDGIYFKIEKVRGKTDKENFDAKRTLEDGASNARSNEFFNDSKPEQNGAGTKRMETLLSNFTESIGDQQDQNFSQDDNVVQEKKMKQRKDYSNTKVKTRNLLTNVSYRRFKQSDFMKNSFIINILSFSVQNFNPII